jgi:histone deacetylase complex regulatory component SIN3
MIKMDSEVLRYLREDEKMTDKIALRVLGKLERHPDILQEFGQWIGSKEFPRGAAISIEGSTAERLVKSTYLRPVGAYNYLIYLREKPKEALEDLKRGLPRK